MAKPTTLRALLAYATKYSCCLKSGDVETAFLTADMDCEVWVRMPPFWGGENEAIDVKMPKIDGFELYNEIKKIDNRTKVCFITAFEVYYRSLRELFPQIEIDCFIKKPIETEELVKRIQAELQ